MYSAQNQAVLSNWSNDNNFVKPTFYVTAAILLIWHFTYLELSLRHPLMAEEAIPDENDAVGLYEEVEYQAEDESLIGLWQSQIAFVVLTFILALNSRFLIIAINGTVSSTWISRTFLGFVLIPLVSGGSETLTSVMVATLNRMDFVSKDTSPQYSSNLMVPR